MSHDHVFLVFFFFFLAMLLSPWDLSWTLPLNWKQCYNHWTAEEVHDHFFIFIFFNHCLINIFSLPVPLLNPSRNLFSIWESVLFNIWAEYFLSMNSLSCHVEMKLDKTMFHIKVVFALYPFALWMAHTGSLMFPWKRKLMGLLELQNLPDTVLHDKPSV